MNIMLEFSLYLWGHSADSGHIIAGIEKVNSVLLQLKLTKPLIDRLSILTNKQTNTCIYNNNNTKTVYQLHLKPDESCSVLGKGVGSNLALQQLLRTHKLLRETLLTRPLCGWHGPARNSFKEI